MDPREPHELVIRLTCFYSPCEERVTKHFYDSILNEVFGYCDRHVPYRTGHPAMTPMSREEVAVWEVMAS